LGFGVEVFSWIGIVAGSVAYEVALLRARTLPPWMAVLLMLGGLLMLVMFFDRRLIMYMPNAQTLPLVVAWMILGIGLMSSKLRPYVDLAQLRQLAAEHGDLFSALRSDNPPQEVLDLIHLLTNILRSRQREKIRSPTDAAAMLMVDMAHLDQEELRTVLLDTKNQVHGIVTIYRGSLNASMVRVSEVYKAALRRNSAAIIVAHNHPSGEPEPSPEDVLLTRHLVDAGKLLDVECLDHLVIGQGRWISLRERGLGFGR
jgi:DNA repair protein RadC